jgi:hypothetical protein
VTRASEQERNISMTERMWNNENRGRLADSLNRPTPCQADGGVASAMPANDLPPGILNSNSIPMTKDAHAAGRHSALQNLSLKPGEKSRASYTSEIHRRIHGRDVKYR